MDKDTTDNINATAQDARETPPLGTPTAAEWFKAKRLARYAAISADIIALIGNPDLRAPSLRDCTIFVSSLIDNNRRRKDGARERCVCFIMGITRKGEDGNARCILSRYYRDQSEITETLRSGNLEARGDYAERRSESDIEREQGGAE